MLDGERLWTRPAPLAHLLQRPTIALIEGAVRDLEGFSEEVMTPLLGHWPSWDYPLPDGLALCVACWRPITARQLGVESCRGARREKLAECLK
jgi:hypothetical protein